MRVNAQGDVELRHELPDSNSFLTPLSRLKVQMLQLQHQGAHMPGFLPHECMPASSAIL